MRTRLRADSYGYGTALLGAVAGAAIGCLFIGTLWFLAHPIFIVGAVAPFVGVAAGAGAWWALQRAGRKRALATGIVLAILAVVAAVEVLVFVPAQLATRLLAVGEVLGLVAVGALISRALARFTFRGEDSARPAKRGALVAGITALVLVGAAAGTFNVVMLGNLKQSFEALRTAFLPPNGPFTVCTKAMAQTCAQEAANRLGLAVAWVPAVPGYGFNRMEAGPLLSEQDFLKTSGDAALLAVASEPLTPAQGQVVGSSASGTDVGTVRSFDSGGPSTTIEIDWTHQGVPYALSLFGMFLPANRGLAEQVFREIRYAVPAQDTGLTVTGLFLRPCDTSTCPNGQVQIPAKGQCSTMDRALSYVSESVRLPGTRAEVSVHIQVPDGPPGTYSAVTPLIYGTTPATVFIDPGPGLPAILNATSGMVQRSFTHGRWPSGGVSATVSNGPRALSAQVSGTWTCSIVLVGTPTGPSSPTPSP